MRISDWSSDVCSSDLRGRQSGTQHHFIERDRAEFRSRIAAQISVKLAEWGAGDAINQNLRRAHAGCAFGTTASCLIAAKSSLPFAVRGSSLRKSHCLGVRMPSISRAAGDRKSGGEGKSVSVRLSLGGGRTSQKKKT